MPTRQINGLTYRRFAAIPPLRQAALVWIDGTAIWACNPAHEAWWREQEFYVMLALIAAGCVKRDRQQVLFDMPGNWYGVLDGDPRAFALYQRHYSYRQYKRQRTNRLIAGPGEKLLLLTLQCDALFVWRKFIDDSGQQGVNCAVFRNEGPVQSSELIREAMGIAWRRWPGERLYTYVNADKIKSSNPGYCFKKAGWRTCGETKNGLIVLECLPEVRQQALFDRREVA